MKCPYIPTLLTFIFLAAGCTSPEAPIDDPVVHEAPAAPAADLSPFAADLHRNTELVLCVSGLAGCHGELPGVTSDCPVDYKHKAEIRVMSLVEGPEKADAGLNACDCSSPLNLRRHSVLPF